MAEKASRRGAVNLGTILMILAFGVIGGFMVWLSDQAAAERALVIVEDTVTVDDFASATVVAVADIRMDASPFEGQMIRLEGLSVNSKLGQQGFWLDTDTLGNAFLVSLSQSLLADSTLVVEQGDTVTVTGTIVARNDLIVTAWVDAGTISAGERLAADFVAYFMDAQQVMVTAPAGSGASGGR